MGFLLILILIGLIKLYRYCYYYYLHLKMLIFIHKFNVNLIHLINIFKENDSKNINGKQ